MAQEEALELFKVWFEQPISRMSDDDGFVAMMVALPLFERLVLAKHPRKSYPDERWELNRFIAQELHLSKPEDGALFWEGVRDGLLHRGMPKDEVGRMEKEKFHWRFSSSFDALPVPNTVKGKRVFDIDPLKFARYVVNEFLKQPELILESHEFPFASVLPLEPDAKAVPLDTLAKYPQQPYTPTQATGTTVASMWDPIKPSPID